MTRPLADEFAKQFQDVSEHWSEWKSLAGDSHDAEVKTQFEEAHGKFVTLGEAVIKSDSPTTAQLAEMWTAAHKADDILDEHLKWVEGET